MQIADHTVASIDYTLTGPDGKVIDSSRGRGPLAYLHGASNIIPGLESALAGKTSGDEFVVVVPPERAYGPHDPNMVQPVPRGNFDGIKEILPGMQFEARTPQGARVVRVVKVDPDSVTIDANHPLAGVELQFAITVIDVRQATAEEISHGHPHGPGGHQH